jgi:epoxyqueuosine reductase
MPDTISRTLTQYSCQSRVVPIRRIDDLRNELARFAEAEELNGFQRFIVEKLYRYDAPDIGFEPQSVVIVAAPSPAYANVTFTHAGETIQVKCLHPARIAGEAAPGILLSVLKNLL